MDRRDFMKTFGAASVAGVAGAVGSAGLLGATAGRAGASGGLDGVPSEGRDALLELLDAVGDTHAKFMSPEMGVTDPDHIAEGARAIAHTLHTALAFWMEADPDRPYFQPYVTPHRKLLGCNPDSVYFFAPIRDDREYRVKGNVGAATFTSFTIEKGSGEGHAAKGSVAALADEEMEIAPDGSFEITVSRKKPARGNWLQLSDGAGQITTRHYHESRNRIAATPNPGVSLQIEAVDPAPLQSYGGDSAVAARLRWVANYVREHGAMGLAPPDPKRFERFGGWYSPVANQFTKPGQWVGQNSAYGNTHAWYMASTFELARDEALVIDGRFPACRFANVVLWNHFMQSLDYSKRVISYNRNQVSYEEDGSFRLVVAARDPGVPNWLDTEGRPTGVVYWRYMFPSETPEGVETQVVKLDSVGGLRRA